MHPRKNFMKNTSNTASWGVYHESMGNNNRMFLNTTDTTSGGVWENTSPTSTVFSVDGGTITGGSGHVEIAYCFAEAPGFSHFGSYEGNSGANGTFTYTGFRPSLVLHKNTESANAWEIRDEKRSFNLNGDTLWPNSTDAGSVGEGLDFLSNGFKCRASGGGQNAGDKKYIYAAFGQSLVGTNNVVCTAR